MDADGAKILDRRGRLLVASAELATRLQLLAAKVWDADMRPTAIELGPDVMGALSEAGLSGAVLFGMDVRTRSEPGFAVLALPQRRIGRYEVVIPTRFEEEG
jgi:hypothetical protein